MIVYTGNTRFIVPVEQAGVEHLGNFSNKYLSVYKYNPAQRVWALTYKYSWYDTFQKEVSYPIGYFEEFKNFMAELNIPVHEKERLPITPLPITLKMKKGCDPRGHQVEPINWIKNSWVPRKALSLQTGKGKTFCSIYAAIEMGVATLVCTYTNLKGWKDEFLKFTNIDEDDVLVVTGSPAFYKLYKKKLKPSVIVIQTMTMRSVLENTAAFKKRYGVSPYEIMEHLGIGLKIVDENHRYLHANTLVDLAFDIGVTRYLSATMKRSDPNENRIFDKLVPQKIRYAGEYKKYAIGYFYEYDIEMPKDSYVRTVGWGDDKQSIGYDQYKYEKDLYGVRVIREEFLAILKQLIKAHYLEVKRPDQRILIFVHKVSFIDKLVKWLKPLFSEQGLTIKGFYGGVDHEVLSSVDCIISTLGSCSDARNIPDLRTLINTVSFKAANSIEQQLGRLREIKKYPEPPIFIDMFNSSISSHVNHMQTRKKKSKELLKEYHEEKI